MSLKDRVVKWGIAGAGHISGDFVNAILNNLDPFNHKVVAVTARSQQTSKIFAKKYGIPNAFEGYEALAACDEVNVVYVGTINTTHLSVVKMLLSAGKHVLCEKPLGMNVKETQEMVELAHKQKLFLMEAIWSRCLPSYKKVKELLERGAIGDVILAESNFGRIITAERMMKQELGGGTTLDLGVYCIQFSSLAFNGERPVKVIAAGHLSNEDGTGVDTDVSGTFTYKNGGTARFQTHCRLDLESKATIYGTKGSITLPEPFWTATQLQISMNKGEKCIEPETFQEFPIGKSIIKTGVDYKFDNAANLAYEADHVRDCLLEGLLESPKITLKESLLIAELMEKVRKQVGVSYLQD